MIDLLRFLFFVFFDSNSYDIILFADHDCNPFINESL